MCYSKLIRLVVKLQKKVLSFSQPCKIFIAILFSYYILYIFDAVDYSTHPLI